MSEMNNKVTNNNQVKIKIAIIGLGVMGQRFIKALQAPDVVSDIEIEAVCDSSEDAIQTFLQDHPNVKSDTDYAALLDKSDADLVYVAVPPALHYDVAMKAIERNMHILCEKPLANAISEAKEMVQKVREAKLVNAMNFPLNYAPESHLFASLVKDGFIGDLRRVRLVMHFPQWPRAWQQNEWVAGKEQGGFTLEVGVHWIQMIQKLFGDITHIQSMIEESPNPNESERGILATMFLEDGTPINIDGLSHVAGDEQLSLTLYGTEGTLTIENWRLMKGGKIGEPMEDITDDWLQKYNISAPSTSSESLAKNVITALKGDNQEAELYDFMVGYKAQVVLEALRRPETNELQDLRRFYF